MYHRAMLSRALASSLASAVLTTVLACQPSPAGSTATVSPVPAGAVQPAPTPGVALVAGNGDNMYVGCFRDQGDPAPGTQGRDLAGEVQVMGNLTITACAQHCASRGFAYAGLQFGNQCFCGNTYGKYGADIDSECNMPCAGDPRQMCGATWHNAIYKMAR
jgi:hypothetical protein